jgi:tRNA dimethylallyltransferase
MDAIRLLAIVGPTATGKTGVAVEVAKRLGGEIVSADSMLIYRYMDIGTAKPTAGERQGIPHHMIDVVNPDETYSVALYQEQAERCIKEIASRGKLPLLVGGTGLYVRAVLERYNFPPAGYDPELRRRLNEEAEICGVREMHRRLAAVDPEAAEKIHPHNLKRVIRALEIYYLTGCPSSRRKRRKEGPGYHVAVFGLFLDRPLLYRRIEERVDKMLAAGLVEEVRQLLARGYGPELVSMQGLGYKEIAQYLLGRVTLDEAVRLLKRNTRRFAKRQLTWFGRDPRIRWIDVGGFQEKKDLAGEIVRLAEGVFEEASKS